MISNSRVNLNFVFFAETVLQTISSLSQNSASCSYYFFITEPNTSNHSNLNLANLCYFGKELESINDSSGLRSGDSNLNSCEETNP